MQTANRNSTEVRVGRRDFIHMSAGACAITPLIPSSFFQLSASLSRSLTKEERDSMTPAQVIDELKNGNERFRTGKMTRRDYLAEQRSSAKGQYPAAVILGCLDSRVPAKLSSTPVSATRIHRASRRNVVNDDILGSIEFGCAASGSKSFWFLGHGMPERSGRHRRCCAGNLTGSRAYRPAVARQNMTEKSSKNYAGVDAVRNQRQAGGRRDPPPQPGPRGPVKEGNHCHRGRNVRSDDWQGEVSADMKCLWRPCWAVCECPAGLGSRFHLGNSGFIL
jgi:carbonic anhydrase